MSFGSEQGVVKLCEFVAHNNHVTCTRIAPNGRILATGGEDNIINIWHMPNAAKIHCFDGNKSAISCLSFEQQQQQLLLSGAMSGSVKTFDLEKLKLVRNIRGHQVHVTDVQYHPHRDIVGSSGMDNAVKLWDIRSRDLIHSYSCNDTITALRFTPDGKWVAAASRDGGITIWDLEAAKQFCVLRSALGVPLSIEFHPQQLLLASRTSARCVRFWDLQRFEECGSTTTEVGQIQAMAFDPNEATLATASNDNLRTWTWEPEVSAKLMIPQAGWGQVSELQFNNSGELFGASYSSNFVSTWKIDPEANRVPSQPRKVAPSKSRLARGSSGGPGTPAMDGGYKAEDRRSAKYSPDDDDDTSDSPFEQQSKGQYRPGGRRSQPVQYPEPDENRFEQRGAHYNSAYDDPKQAPEFQVQFAKQPAPEPSRQQQPSREEALSAAPAVKMAAEDDASIAGLDALLEGAHTTTLLLSARLPHIRLLQQYWSQGEMNHLLTHLETLCSTLPLGDASQAIVLASFFDVINLKASCMSLDAAARLFPILEAMLDGSHELKTIQVALNSILKLLDSFGEMIMSMRGIIAGGVDVAREARIDRCNRCYDALHRIRRKTPKLARMFQRDRQVTDMIDELHRRWTD